MPVSPYTEPIQFEYKPLNLAAFAVPLAQMQEKFDVMLLDKMNVCFKQGEFVQYKELKDFKKDKLFKY